MGVQYLWVDDVCIQETASLSKVSQFGDMHKIYGNASFTIIAAQGANADAGLYGVRPGSRPAFKGQISSAVTDHMSLVREIAVPAAINASPWSGRAWCFQEQLLSKAFLVFWDNQAYWQCPESICFEDLSADSKTRLLRKEYDAMFGNMKRPDQDFHNPINQCLVSQLPLISQILNPHPPAGLMDRNTLIRGNGSTLVVRPQVFEEYTNIVQRYSRRSLTHPSDALRAIDGILTVLSHGFRSDMLHGLPESFLDAAMLWRAATPLVRRCAETIPSWSWAGWQGEVVYQDTVEAQIWTDPNSKQIEYYLKPSRSAQDGSGREHFERLRPWTQWYTCSTLEQLERQLEAQPRLVNGGVGIRCENSVRPDDWMQREHTKGFPQAALEAWTPKPMDPLSLQFYTLRTSSHRLGSHFEINHKKEIRRARKRGGYRHPHSEDVEQRPSEHLDLTVELLDINDYIVGHLTRDEALRVFGHGRQAALVVLSEAQLFDDVGLNVRLDILPLKEDRSSLFNVMLVELDTETMIATRKGIGKVTKEAFHGWGGLEWGPIILR